MRARRRQRRTPSTPFFAWPTPSRAPPDCSGWMPSCPSCTWWKPRSIAYASARCAMDAEFAVLLLSCKDHIEALVAAVDSGEQNAECAARSAQRRTEHVAAGQGGRGQRRNRQRRRTNAAPQAARGECARRSSRAGGQRTLACLGALQAGCAAGRHGPAVVHPLPHHASARSRASSVVADALPAATDFDPETCYLGFEIGLCQRRRRVAHPRRVRIRSAMTACCSVLPPHSPVLAYLRAMPEFATDPARAARSCVRCGSLTQHEVERGAAG